MIPISALFVNALSFPGGGLLRLHSTYRHDLKIYSSDEGRVQVRPFGRFVLSVQSHAFCTLLRTCATPRQTSHDRVKQTSNFNEHTIQ